MDGVLILFAFIVAGLVFFGALAQSFGIDSRYDFGDQHSAAGTLS